MCVCVVPRHPHQACATNERQACSTSHLGAVSLVGLCIYALNPRESLEDLWHPVRPYRSLQRHMGEHTASPSLDTLTAAELCAGHREAGVGPPQCEEFLPLHLQSVPLTLGFCIIMKKGCTQTQPMTGLRTTERLHRVVRYGSSTLVVNAANTCYRGH